MGMLEDSVFYAKKILYTLASNRDVFSKVLKKVTEKPLTMITWGYEKEFALIKARHRVIRNLEDSELRRIDSEARLYLNFHKDYAWVYEMTTPVMGYPPRCSDLVLMSIVEAIAAVHGAIVSEYAYSLCCDGDERTCGSHIHFRSTPMTSAKMHNWLVFLTPLISPLITLGRRIVASSWDTWEIDEAALQGYRYRFMLFHYAEVPRYISTYEITDAENTYNHFRGYDPERDHNRFYLVEINKYRKPIWTIEYRANEQHPVAGIVLLDILRALREEPVPIVNVSKYYRWLPTTIPARVSSAIEIPFIKDHPIKRELGKEISPKDFASYLLQKYDNKLLKVTKIALSIVEKGERVTYLDYQSMHNVLLEECERTDNSLPGLARELNILVKTMIAKRYA